MLPRLKFEITGLVNEILDKLPADVFKSATTTFLDPALAGGQFAVEIIRRLREYGHSDANIAERVFGLSQSRIGLGYAIRTQKLIGKYSIGGIEELEQMVKQGKKFDVIVGNPPYQDTNKGDAKRWPLWHKFIEQSLILCRDGGVVALITPNSWMSPGSAYDMVTSRTLQYVSLDVGHHFDVNSTFSYFIIENSIQADAVTIIWTGAKNVGVNLSEVQFLPATLSNESLSINNKTVNSSMYSKFEFTRTTEYHTTDKSKFITNGKTRVIHTNAQTLYTNLQHRNNELHRVAITLSGYPTPEYIHNTGVTQAVAWVSTPDASTGQQLEHVLGSKIYRFLIQQNKWSGWNSLAVLKLLPAVDLTRSWTDAQLYKHFKLTQEEIDLIEATVK